MEQAGDVSSSSNQDQEMEPMQAAAIGLVELRNFLSQAVNEIDAAQRFAQYLNEPDLDVPHNTPCDEAEMNALMDSDDDDPHAEDVVNKDKRDDVPTMNEEETVEAVDRGGNDEQNNADFYAHGEQKVEQTDDDEVQVAEEKEQDDDEGVWLRKPPGYQPENEEGINEETKDALTEQEDCENEHALPVEPRKTPQEQTRDGEDDGEWLRKPKGELLDESDDDDVMIVDEIPKKAEICDICGRVSKSLKHHYGLFHPKKRYNPLVKCPICGRPNLHKNSVSRHLMTHKGPRTMRCVVCPQIFTRQWDLMDHMEAEHLKEDEF